MAVAYRSSRDGARLDVETASNSSLRWVVGADGTWTYLGGEWVDEYGRVHRTTLMRPTLRGIARAAAPDHEAVLEVLVRDVDLAAGALIETAEVLRRRAAAIQPADARGADRAHVADALAGRPGDAVEDDEPRRRPGRHDADGPRRTRPRRAVPARRVPRPSTRVAS